MPPSDHGRGGVVARIALVCFPVNPGLADYLVGLANALRQHADVTVMTSDTMAAANQAMLRSANYCFRRSRHLPIDVWGYIWRVLRLRPDIVLVQAWLKFPLIEIPIIKLFQLFKLRCVVTVHDVLPHEPGRFDRFILSRYYNAFDGLVAHSNAARMELEAMGITRPISVIPHALLDSFHREELSQTEARARLSGLGLSADSFVALFFGHVTRRKGVLEFAEAAKHLSPDSGIKLIISGQPDLPHADLDRLRETCERYGVIFQEGLLPFEQVQTYFTTADCVVIPYLEGTTSGVLKIAIAFEKPIVATAIGDVTETVDARSAIIIPTTELPSMIAGALMEAKRNAKPLAEGVRALKAELGWDYIGRRYHAFLADMVTSHVAVAQDSVTAHPAGSN